MNWANRLTVGRFFLTLIFVAALSCTFPLHYTLALVLFVIAGITDYMDGEIARRCSLVTDFGKLMDPLIDKIMMASAFICLVPIGAMPAWVVVIIISREFLVTGLRLLAISKGQVLAAESLGKHKTAWQIATVIFYLLLLSIRELTHFEANNLPVWYQWLWRPAGTVLLAVAVALTLVSGVGYLWKNRAVIQMR
ncbi:MAG: CDP-diacylglycerol---glycerol-3-phosphate 3-phosphatidyltransferase [Chthoniobacter sp.]|jgi:CDP-diacylglycerol--glycerol-3-phosphate 3-phosphatidyltransferase|nr:CDP-diacylglycerol---glycerol-3-phosphate 3-phosphatidyltransferase [Chthoniobacter sp.]